jgi:hypothetical protein
VRIVFQVLEVFHLKCIDGDWNFHSSLTLAIVAPIVVGMCFVIYVAVSWFIFTPKQHKAARERALKYFMIFLYCVYPVASNYGIDVCEHGRALECDTLLDIWQCARRSIAKISTMAPLKAYHC